MGREKYNCKESQICLDNQTPELQRGPGFGFYKARIRLHEHDLAGDYKKLTLKENIKNITTVTAEERERREWTKRQAELDRQNRQEEKAARAETAELDRQDRRDGKSSENL